MKKALSVVTDDINPAPLGGLQTIRGALRNKRGLSVSLPEVLISVGIGIFVLAGSAGAAAAINFSRDGQAQSQLDNVKSAESLINSKTGSYGNLDTLTAGDTPALSDASDDSHLAIAANDTQYCAIVKSKSMTGTTYWLTAKSGEILKEAPTAAEAGIACPTL